MTETEEKREAQRVEKEARDIIHDVNKLRSFSEKEKTRWVWELLQNAKDAATDNGVDVIYELKDDKVVISHNGLPFETEHLLALLYKTSTKSLGNEDGSTGKYGTGFVTTHVLNKKLTVRGVHRNSKGLRQFSFDIDRNSVSLQEDLALKAIKKSLKETFDVINKIVESEPESIEENIHSFTYELSPNSKKIAELGLQELEQSIDFVLLINSKEKKRINSVTVIKNGDERTYKLANPQVIGNINYIETADIEGVLYFDFEDLTIGVPVIKNEDKFEIQSIEGKSVLFKEFPLIGSENFNLPLFIQHRSFIPTEKRDGISTNKEDENAEDAIADTNRKCLQEFTEKYKSFIKSLTNIEALGLYNIALSGLPENTDNSLNIEWHKDNIQTPIRKLLYDYQLLKTVSGDYIKIADAVFTEKDLIDDYDFYQIISKFLPEKVACAEEYQLWNKIIHQEKDNWGDIKFITLKDLLQEIPDIVDLENDESYFNLNLLYDYLELKKSTLGESIPIYPNQNKKFKVRDQIKLYPTISHQIKSISKALGWDLDEVFLNKQLGHIVSIQSFDLNLFYESLNRDYISGLDSNIATENEINAVLYMNSLLRSDRAQKREYWLSIIKELLPKNIKEKEIISVDYENYYTVAELWTAKYICLLIQETKKVDVFAQKYFEGDVKRTYSWLSKFLNYILDSRDDIKIFKERYKILPTQDEFFKQDSESILKEDKPELFDEKLKDIARDYANIDIRSSLLINELTIDNFRTTTIQKLTDLIDKLFDSHDIVNEVKSGGRLHDAFFEVNHWFEKNESDPPSYLKTFSAKRNMLYVIWLGEDFSDSIMRLKDSGKTIDDITELSKINLSVAEMKKLEEVAKKLGTEELLKKANELIQLKEQREKWKKIGTAAENAFKNVFANLDFEMEIENPDEGKDFEILLRSEKFSIEIKNVIEGKGNVRMSILQGRTAVKEQKNYALCVVTRPNDIFEIDEEYFKKNAMFIDDIGYQIGDKISNWDNGLSMLQMYDNIGVNLDDKKESVYINRSIWQNGKSFDLFIDSLKKYFSI